MSIGRSISLSVLAVVLLMPRTVRAEMAAQLTPETASLLIYEPFTLRLEVESDTDPETPELPAVPGLAVTTVRRLPSDPARRKHVFQIEMIAERDGILTIPPFAVRARGEMTLTSALRLRISSARVRHRDGLESRRRTDHLESRATRDCYRHVEQRSVVCPVQATPVRNPASGWTSGVTSFRSSLLFLSRKVSGCR